MPAIEPPLIVTLQLAKEGMQFFNKLRKEHFPAHINYLGAHLTLFHNLPSNESLVSNALKEFAQTTPFTLRISMVKHICNGVVYVAQSSALQRMHLKMQLQFKPWLIRKDAQKLWPHITVQNKVTAYKSGLLHKKLSSEFEPFEIEAIGLKTWLYLKGPWQEEGYYPFSAK